MLTRFSLAICLLGGLAFTSCHEDSTLLTTLDEQADATSPLLSVHEPERLAGSHATGDLTVDYTVQLKEDVYHLDLHVADKHLTAAANYNDFSLSFDGHGQFLTAAEALALNATAVQLGERFFADNTDEHGDFQVTLAENTLFRVMDFFSYVPPNYAIGQYQVTDAGQQKSRNNDGVSCVRRGNYYTISWDDRRGNRTARDQAGRNRGGNYNCMARCGAGCGRWWIPSSWTLDCFEHDECSRQNNSSGGAADSNCGDEWVHAADDWTFGVVRGCGG